MFLPSLRWIAPDPTNDILAGERHVPVVIVHRRDGGPGRGRDSILGSSTDEVSLAKRRERDNGHPDPADPGTGAMFP
jgi:hypothetical protein